MSLSPCAMFVLFQPASTTSIRRMTKAREQARKGKAVAKIKKDSKVSAANNDLKTFWVKFTTSVRSITLAAESEEAVKEVLENMTLGEVMSTSYEGPLTKKVQIVSATPLFFDNDEEEEEEEEEEDFGDNRAEPLGKGDVGDFDDDGGEKPSFSI